MRRHGWLLAVLGSVAAVGCGADGYSGDDDDDVTDAGASYCDMSVSVSPTSPQAPATIVATGSIDTSWLSGLESFEWSVTLSGTPITTTPRDASGSEIEFEAPVAGPYRIVLSGSVDGTGCAQHITTVNVTVPNANEVSYRLALIPRADLPAPPQLQLITVPGGADFDIGPRTLQSGLLLAGSLQAASGATPGYVRAVATADPVLAIPREAFADASGGFSLRLLAGAYDVLVVPDGDAIAPVMLRGIEAAALAGTVAVPDATAVAGTVVRADDSPVVGARVALTIAGVPSTIGTTDSTGAFTVLAHTGGATSVSVVPDDGSLPRLELEASAGLVADAATPLAIRYAAGVAARSEAVTLVASDGATPVPGATVTLLARTIAAAGTVTPGAGASLEAGGEVRVSASADGAGAVGPLPLPPAVYDVVVAPPPGSMGADVARLAVIDLTGGAPALSTLALAVSAQVGGAAPGVPAGTRVTAVPRGVLARAAVATVETATAVADRVDLALVGGGEYDVTLHLDAASGRAPVRFVATAPAAAASLELEPIAVVDAISITGSVQSPDIAGGVSGVAVWLLCGDCTGPAAATPIAETVSGNGGGFTLLVPDPAASE